MRGAQQYCTKLSSLYRILYIHSPDQKANYQDVRYFSVKLHKVSDDIYEVFWPCWCREVFRFAIVEKLLERIRVFIIQFILRKLNWQEIDFLYVLQPAMYKYIKYFPQYKKICHIFDQYSLYGGNTNQKIIELENEFLPKFDIVFCVSRLLYEDKKALNKGTSYLPNGVNFELFRKATGNNCSIPKDVQEIKRPVIGYIGYVSGKINIDLIQFLAQKKSKWSFLFIGPKKLSGNDAYKFNQLCLLDNFYYLGYRAPDSLPNYMKAIDVGIMPYRMRGHVLWVDSPLKIYEYLAAGLPSVASKFRSIPQHLRGAEIYFASNENEWLGLIECCLREGKDPEKIRTRQKIASENTWDSRFYEFMKAVKGLEK